MTTVQAEQTRRLDVLIEERMVVGRDLEIRLRDGTLYRGTIVGRGHDREKYWFNLNFLATKRTRDEMWWRYFSGPTRVNFPADQHGSIREGSILWERSKAILRVLPMVEGNLTKDGVIGFEILEMTEPL